MGKGAFIETALFSLFYSFYGIIDISILLKSIEIYPESGFEARYERVFDLWKEKKDISLGFINI